MLWYLGPRKSGSPSPTQVMQAFCNKFSFGGCGLPLFTCDGCSQVAPTAVSDFTTVRTVSQTALISAPGDISTGFTYGQPNQMPFPISMPRAAVADFPGLIPNPLNPSAYATAGLSSTAATNATSQPAASVEETRTTP